MIDDQQVEALAAEKPDATEDAPRQLDPKVSPTLRPPPPPVFDPKAPGVIKSMCNLFPAGGGHCPICGEFEEPDWEAEDSTSSRGP